MQKARGMGGTGVRGQKAASIMRKRKIAKLNMYQNTAYLHAQRMMILRSIILLASNQPVVIQYIPRRTNYFTFSHKTVCKKNRNYTTATPRTHNRICNQWYMVQMKCQDILSTQHWKCGTHAYITRRHVQYTQRRTIYYVFIVHRKGVQTYEIRSENNWEQIFKTNKRERERRGGRVKRKAQKKRKNIFGCWHIAMCHSFCACVLYLPNSFPEKLKLAFEWRESTNNLPSSRLGAINEKPCFCTPLVRFLSLGCALVFAQWIATIMAHIHSSAETWAKNRNWFYYSYAFVYFYFYSSIVSNQCSIFYTISFKIVL